MPIAEVARALGKAGALTSQETLAAGMLRPAHLLDLVRHFTLFAQDGGRTVKLVARYQQYRAVREATARLRTGATRLQDGVQDRRGGIVWHTQGSGKSLTMVFLVREPALRPGAAPLQGRRRHRPHRPPGPARRRRRPDRRRRQGRRLRRPAPDAAGRARAGPGLRHDPEVPRRRRRHRRRGRRRGAARRRRGRRRRGGRLPGAQRGRGDPRPGRRGPPLPGQHPARQPAPRPAQLRPRSASPAPPSSWATASGRTTSSATSSTATPSASPRPTAPPSRSSTRAAPPRATSPTAAASTPLFEDFFRGFDPEELERHPAASTPPTATSWRRRS